LNDLLENPVLDQRIEFDAENISQLIAEQRFSSFQLAPLNPIYPSAAVDGYAGTRIAVRDEHVAPLM